MTRQTMTRPIYDALDEDARKIVDAVRRSLAKDLARTSEVPFDQALEGVIGLHETGYLTLVGDGDRIALVPCLPDGTPVDE